MAGRPATQCGGMRIPAAVRVAVIQFAVVALVLGHGPVPPTVAAEAPARPAGLTDLAGNALADGIVTGRALPEGTATGTPATPAEQPRGRWRLPLAGDPAVARGFDPPSERWGSGHRGVDLAGGEGVRVRAADDGLVTYSGVINGVGIVTVTHSAGLRSTYQPLQHREPRGTVVQRGDDIGRLTARGSHCSADPCLHWGAVSGRRTYHDPLTFVGRPRLVLLPLP